MASLTDFLSNPWILWKILLKICVPHWAKRQPPRVTMGLSMPLSICVEWVCQYDSPVHQSLPPIHLGTSCWWQTFLSGSQPAPFLMHYQFPYKHLWVWFFALAFNLHSVILQYIFIEDLLCTRICTSLWGHNAEPKRHGSALMKLTF